MEENKPVNPYQAPSTENVAAPQDGGSGQFIPGGRTVDAGKGWEWIARGWTIFTVAPLIWIIDIVILCAIVFLLSLIPFLGHIATNVLYPVLGAGLMISAHSAAQSHPPEVAQLFAGFKEKVGPLMVVGVLYLVGWIALFVFLGVVGAVLLGASGLFMAMLSGDSARIAAMFGSMSISVLILFLLMLALSIPLMMAVWFAPALVTFHNVEPLAAMKMSFGACLKNFIPFLVYGVIIFILGIVASIPLLLGWLVLGPLMITSVYTAYRDIFVAAEA